MTCQLAVSNIVVEAIRDITKEEFVGHEDTIDLQKMRLKTASMHGYRKDMWNQKSVDKFLWVLYKWDCKKPLKYDMVTTAYRGEYIEPYLKECLKEHWCRNWDILMQYPEYWIEKHKIADDDTVAARELVKGALQILLGSNPETSPKKRLRTDKDKAVIAPVGWCGKEYISLLRNEILS